MSENLYKGVSSILSISGGQSAFQMAAVEYINMTMA